MKRIIFGFLTLTFALSRSFGSPLITPPDTIPSYSEDTVMSDLNFDQNLDSLLNLYYVEQSLASDPDFWTVGSDSLVPEYSDSVYVSRLKRIPSVVDLSYNSIVRRYIEVYTKQKRANVSVMLGLAQYYFPIFDDIFDQYDIPNEMKYMSIIESALNPRAYSRTRAVGLWQFMFGTGRLYGLTVNSLVDERRDPIKSTYAAARFCKDLYNIYHDWTLVIAAYNCGPGNVNKAIRRSGGKKNYWEIYYYLPRETRGHVPAFIAATYVMNYYREHNLSPMPMSFPLASDTIMVTKNLHLAQVSDVLGVPIQLLRDMNPQYRTDIIPVNGGHPMALRLPLDQTARFIDMSNNIYAYKDSVYFDPEKVITTPTAVSSSGAELPSGNYTKLSYTVKSGDNLGLIAMWYNVRISDLRYWNGIRHNTIRVGQRLAVYVPNNKALRYDDINKLSFAAKQARVGKGTVAPVSATVDSNATADATPRTGSYVTYTVKKGDTVWDIMKMYGVSESEIKQWNDLSNLSKIQAGQKLKIRQKS
jgi:membrane-bound lytic murein transglycosylase D